MRKDEAVMCADEYVQIADVFLVGAYNHMEHIKTVLKKEDVHIKFAMDLAQANIWSSIRTLDNMIKRLKET